LSVDFENTFYDYDNMLDSYNRSISNPNYTEEERDAVATLMYHCQTASRYGPESESGETSESGPQRGFFNHFRFTEG